MLSDGGAMTDALSSAALRASLDSLSGGLMFGVLANTVFYADGPSSAAAHPGGDAPDASEHTSNSSEARATDATARSSKTDRRLGDSEGSRLAALPPRQPSPSSPSPSPSPSPRTAAAATVPQLEHISAAMRLRGLEAGVAQLKRMMAEFERVTAPPQASRPSSPAAAPTTTPHNAKLFSEACGLQWKPTGSRALTRRAAAAAAAAAAASRPPAVTLAQLKDAFAEITRLRAYQEELPSSSSSSQNPVALLVARMVDAIAAAADALSAATDDRPHGAAAATLLPQDQLSKAVAQAAAWPQPFLRLLNECLQAPTLDALVDAPREELRRAQFDVEELQHEQAAAVTDGDMQRSEEIYFAQTEVLAGMEPLFDKLDAMLTSFEQDRVERPRRQLANLREDFTRASAEVLDQLASQHQCMQDDLQRLDAKLLALHQLRGQQAAGLALYTTEWERSFSENTRQQSECLSAIAQLEDKLQMLSREQHFLVQDRADRLMEEHDRRVAAAAFTAFASTHTAALTSTAQQQSALLTGLRKIRSAMDYSLNQLDAFLTDVVQQRAAAALLASKQERLAQFRTLYLTLGDLGFKKTRHAEEVAKQVQYYALQQEIAMDALNPKAKDFSKSRQQWATLQEEVNGQVSAIERRAQRELANFKPTEQWLLEAGVSFVSPEEELAQRNQARLQKLLDYKMLMDRQSTGEGDDGGSNAANGHNGTVATLPTRSTAGAAATTTTATMPTTRAQSSSAAAAAAAAVFHTLPAEGARATGSRRRAADGEASERPALAHASARQSSVQAGKARAPAAPLQLQSTEEDNYGSAGATASREDDARLTSSHGTRGDRRSAGGKRKKKA